jgi:RNA polymerase sigma-70 factor (ECF subfamily)
MKQTASSRWKLLDHMDELARLYWRPVYLHFRHRGYRVEDAQDLTQEFFASFLEEDYARHADSAGGLLRLFLRAAANRFAADRGDGTALLRKGAAKALPLDVAAAEELLAPHETPERHFDRQCARAFLDDALAELGREYDARGQRELFLQLRPALSGSSASVDPVELKRAKARVRELVRARVARMVESPNQIESELAALFGAA